MEIKEEFFKNEVRDGFFVSSLMKRAWAAELEVLSDLDKVCKENNIKYYISYGTLLGAVRHGGFIPWDDDIDVMMFRDEFVKFRSLAKEGKLPFNYKLNSIHSMELYNSSFDHFAASNNVLDFSKEHMEKYHGFPYAGGIDIFPIDSIPSNNISEFKDNVGILVDIICNLNFDASKNINSRLKELLERKYSVKLNTNKNMLNQIYKIYEKELSKVSEGDDVAYILEWFVRDYNRELKRKWFDECVYLNFEGATFPAPKEYDLVLKSFYSNYRKAERGFDNHEYPFYKKRQEYIKNVTETNIIRYNYEKKDIESIVESKNYKGIKSKILDRIAILDKMTDELLVLENVKEFLKICEQLQTYSISIGEYIEERFSESVSKKLVSYLEEYCETIYEISLSNEYSKDSLLFQRTKGTLSVLKEKVKQEKESGIKKILFVFESENDWKRYGSLYNILSKESDVECIIMQIPYFMLDNQLTANEERLRFDDINIGHEKNTADYHSFDFGKEQVDCIIKSNPYDEYSFGDIIHPFFYTKNLKQYTEIIVHIPTLDICDFSVDDGQMIEMAEYFVKTPGVVNANYTILNSEINVKTYVHLLKEITDEVQWNDRVLYCENDLKTAELIKSLLY